MSWRSASGVVGLSFLLIAAGCGDGARNEGRAPKSELSARDSAMVYIAERDLADRAKRCAAHGPIAGEEQARARRHQQVAYLVAVYRAQPYARSKEPPFPTTGETLSHSVKLLEGCGELAEAKRLRDALSAR